MPSNGLLRRVLHSALALVISLLLPCGIALADTVFDRWGFDQNRDYFSELPYEHIDPMTGNLVLTFTDLVLPGNAGFDLKIQRTYNSKVYRDYNTSGDTLGEDSWAGVGWSLHLGRVLDPDGTRRTIEMPDGSRHPAYAHRDGSGAFITRDYWLYRKLFPAPVLSLTNGVTYTFGRRVSITNVGAVLLATEIRDPFGNRVTVDYSTSASAPPDAIERITQYLGGSQARVITFTWDTGTQKSARSMTLNAAGRLFTWNFDHQNAPTSPLYSLLTAVRPPVGPAWRHVYNTNVRPFYELTQLTTPSGGQINFVYGDQLFSMPGTTIPVRSRVVTRRTTGGRDVPPGTWTYAYAQGAQRNQSVFNSPCGTTTYTFLGIGNFNVGQRAWQIGLMASRVLSEGAFVHEAEEFTWRASDLISFEEETVGFNSDPDIYVPLVDTRTVIRQSQRYVTRNVYSNSNFNDFGRPFQTIENGELGQRTTTRAFQYFFQQYIADKVAAETVSVGAESFTKSYAYNLGNGFLTSGTVYGIRTDYSQDALGNVRTRRDGNGNTTTFGYSWGIVDFIQTPEHTTTRAINPEGTVASVTRRGFPTSFQYDQLFRITEVRPPTGNWIVTQYDNGGGASRTTFRGNSAVTTFLDGFGRVGGTQNSVGVKTDVAYDACGRRVYESYPFTTVNLGTGYSYDPLNRVKIRSNPDGTQARYEYPFGIDVQIVDENGRLTQQDWNAFGDPSETRLVAVRDAEGYLTTYGYNALGNLTSVQPSQKPGRQLRYNTRNELEFEIHPESGRVDYTYDGGGNLKTRRDAQFGLTTYFYDRNNRLTGIDRPGTAYDAGLGYDASDNLTFLGNGFVASTFTYDGADRLTSRRDDMNGRTLVSGYGWDGNDNLKSVMYPLPIPLTVFYEYDRENRLTLLHNGIGRVFADQFVHHPSGAVESFRAGNGIVHRFTYDRRYRVEDLEAAGVLDLRYGYDGVSNVKSISDSRPGMSQGFDYDDVDRLTIANGFWGLGGFDYDGIGNRTRKAIGTKTTTYNYSPVTNRLDSSLGAEPDQFAYDFNGNVRGIKDANFTYTPENMLESAASGLGTAFYRYDGDNLRKMKVESGKTQYFIHGNTKQLLAELKEGCGGGVEWVRTYVYAGNRLVTSMRPAEPSVSFLAAGASVAEGAGQVAAGVRLSTSDGKPTSCPVAVGYQTANGSAVSGQDYGAAQGTLTFPAGSANGAVLNVTLSILNDALDEYDEDFTLTLTAGEGFSVGPTGTHKVTILDDDPLPELSINDVRVTEGDADGVSAPFMVLLSQPSGRNVGVSYQTADVTARAGRDYDSASGTLTFTPGVTSQTVRVSVKGDLNDEPDETFKVLLANARNAVLVDAEGLGTIEDNDPPPTMSINHAALKEGNEGTRETVLKVRLSRASGFVVEVDYRTVDGTAVAGSDYTETAGRLSFAPDETVKTVRVPILGDTEEEDNESFFVELSKAIFAVLQDARGTVTVFNDESDCVFSVSPVMTSFDFNGGAGRIAVSTTEGCRWEAVATERWITLTSAPSGMGSSEITYQVAMNAEPVFRIGTVVIQGEVVTLKQSGKPVAPPPAAELVSPSGPTYDARPFFTWKPVGEATEYYLSVTKDVQLVAKWYLWQDICSETLCVVESPIALTAGSHTWRIQTKNTVGLGPWSPDMNFVTRPPDAPVLISPSGPLEETTPTFVWKPVIGATDYYLSVRAGSVTVHEQWFRAADVCTKTECAGKPTLVLWGVHDWFLQAGNSFGLGNPSRMSFQGGVPGVASLIRPSGSIETRQPTFEWNAVTNASEYYLTVSRAVAKWYNASEVCSSAACSVTPSLNLSHGSYAWRIQTRGPGGQGPVSAEMTFTVAIPPTVSWTNLVGVAANGNSLTRTSGGGGWNAGAVSVESIVGNGFMELQASETNTYRLIGLSKGDTNQSYTDIDFAVYLRAEGTIEIYEAGLLRGGFGPYATGDRFRIEVVSGLVSYLKDGVVFYTSGVVPSYPLLVDTALYTPGATLTEVDLVDLPEADPGIWKNLVGVEAVAPGNGLRKTVGAGWNAGAVTVAALSGGNGYVSFRATEVNTYRLIGLSNGDTNQSYTDIDHALYLRAEGTLEIYEAGALRGGFGPYASGDRFRIEVVAGIVRYYRNDALLYTSPSAPVFPLLVDTAFYGAGATIAEVRLVASLCGNGVLNAGEECDRGGCCGSDCLLLPRDALCRAAVDECDLEERCTGASAMCPADQCVQDGTACAGGGTCYAGRCERPGAGSVTWKNLVGVTANGNSLTRGLGGGGWDAGAVSLESILVGAGHMEFRASETNTHRMIGLSKGDTNQSYTDIDFAFHVRGDGMLEIYEAGVLRGAFGRYATGDRFRIEVVSGLVRYLKNGVVLYTSAVAPPYPLIVDTSLYTPKATLTDVQLVDLPEPDPGIWAKLVGVEVLAPGNGLRKTAATGWNAGAVTVAAISAGDGYVSFRATETDTYRLIGLSKGDSNQSYTDIDFAIYVRAEGTVEIYEGGLLRGGFGSYASGDRFRVEVVSGLVRYLKNGVVFYTSGVAPSYPLLVDTTFYSQGATIAEVELVDLPEPDPGIWMNLVGVEALAPGNGLRKTAATGWNAGAVSEAAVSSGDACLEFRATETNTYRLIGLSKGDSNQSYTDIDFAIYVRAEGTVEIYEAGLLRGGFGPYASGDRFRVEVVSGLVRYLKNGVVFYTSAVAPSFPLLVDTTFYSQGATIDSVTLAAGSCPSP